MSNSEKRKMKLNKTGTMIPHIVSLISIIISILTLHEMRVERNHAYLPRVTVEESVCRWDSDYTLLKTPYSTIMNLNYLPVFLQTTAGHTLVVDNAFLYENPNIIVSNIGNGIAENITYIFDENNEWSKKIIQLLNKMNSDSPFSLLEDKKTGAVTIQRNGRSFGNTADSCTLQYLLPNCEKTQTVYLPYKCNYLLSLYVTYSYYSHDDFLINLDHIPDLPVKIIYHDIQGNTYKREITLKINGEFMPKEKDELKDDKEASYFNIRFSYDN